MIPNVVPLLLTVGLMAGFGVSITTGNVVCFAVALGLGVDDTIHFLARLQEERQNGRSMRKAIRRTFLGAGPALLYTTLVLGIGLGALCLSDATATRQFAGLTLVTLGSALFADLLLLPALLTLFASNSRQEEAA